MKRNGNDTMNSGKKIKSSRVANSDFKPSMKTVSRIIKVILEKNSIGRTVLSREANINYTTLSKHLDWLKMKSIIEYVVEDGKVNVKLSENGREFALQLQKLSL